MLKFFNKTKRVEILKENKKQKISIIIPIYKVEKYLNKCVQSVVNQTYKNLEIFLVDDGSPDNCPKMCDDWAEKDSRIQVIHKKNGGLSDARNFGIEKATGDYIMFLDSDDYIHEEICKTLLNLITKYDAEISMCDACDVNENEQKIICNNKTTTEINEQVFNKDELIKMLLNRDIKYFMTAWAKLYKTELFKTLRYDVGKIHEDEFILHKLINQTNKLAYVNLPYYYYLQREGSIMQSKKEKSYIDTLEAFEQRFKFLIENTNLKNETITYALRFFKFKYIQIKKSKLSKEIAKKYLFKFKEYYKQAKSKNLTAKAFNLCPNLYTFIYKIFKK